MGNGNLKTWLGVIGIAAALVVAALGVARDTPTRTEMKDEIGESQQAIQIQLQDIKGMVKEIRDLQLEMLMSDGGDRRGEGN